MHFATTLTALLLTSTVLASPASNLEKRIAPNTQSCHAIDDLDQATYIVFVGKPFDKGAGCSGIFADLKGAGVTGSTGNPAEPDGPINDQSDFECTDDGTGMTKLSFLVDQDQADKINAGLSKAFPGIQGGFNCPNF
jgi:hypothetical protein